MKKAGWARFSEIVGPQHVSPFTVFHSDVILIKYATQVHEDACLLVLQDREIVVNILMHEAEEQLTKARLDWERAKLIDQVSNMKHY